MPRTAEERIADWLEGPYDEETKETIRRLKTQNPEELLDAFYQPLAFGTGGMRGLMGVGTNRMNIYTVRLATQGLANYLAKSPKPHTVFIGYDVRHHSRTFAEEAAKVLAGNGIRALLSKDICPTPLVSFACRFFSCSAAIMITASHNPAQYNGYKMYGSDGAQLVFPHDIAIMKEVEKVEALKEVPLSFNYEEIGEELDEAYLKELKKLQFYPGRQLADLQILYTNLHGTGIRLMQKALAAFGYRNVFLVEKQCSLDPNFSFAPSPNPEEKEAMELGLSQLKEQKLDLLLATDPDADRIGVADQKTRFTGHQIACLCLEYICESLKEKNRFPPNAAFIKTIVTTELFRKIAESFHAKCIDVLTGFKYIAELIHIWENKIDGDQFLFGAEESYGYLFGTFVRDKDAISSACLIAEMAAKAKKEGKTLTDRLEALYEKYGIYQETLFTLSFPENLSGMRKIKTLMQHLRETPLEKIDGKPVVKREDYLLKETKLPPSDVLRFWLEGETKVVIRPSGTEPKLKIYLEMKGGDRAECTRHLKQLKEALLAELYERAPNKES